MSRTRFLLWGFAVLVIVFSASAQDVDFRLVAVTTPTGSETVTMLPGSITDVCAGDTYYIELWVSDVGTTNTGVSSAYVDLEWPGAQATAVSIDHGTIYGTLSSGIIMFGKIDELGGSVVSSTGTAIHPEWVRVALVELTADATGDTTFALQPSMTGVAALGRGVILWSEVSLDEVTLAAPGEPGVEVTCGDTIDNDCDGLTDMVDWDCSGECPFTCADIDGSGGDTDLADLVPFSGCFGLSADTSQECECSDLNGDETVDMADFVVFAGLFGVGSTNRPPDCP